MFREKPTMGMSLEAIDFQSGMLGKALEATIASILDLDLPSTIFVNNNSIMNELQKVVKEHTGLNISFRAWNSGTACFLYRINQDGILTGSGLNNSDVKHLLDKMKKYGNKGVVDIKNGKVTGLYSEFEFCIYLSRSTTLKRYTAVPEEGYVVNENAYTVEEIVAVILHEIGHAFNIIEFNNRAVLTNMALAAIVKNADNPNDKEREDTLKFVSNQIFGDSKSLKELENETSGSSSGVIFLTKIGKALKSSTNSFFYDCVGSEAAADAFVSRHGYGKHLVNALRKNENITKLWGYGEETTKLGNLVGGVAKSLGHMFAAGIGVISLGGGSVLFGLGMLTAVYANMYMQTTNYKLKDTNYLTYDNIKTRIQRIREDTIQAIKNKDLDKEATQMFVNNIRDMKRVEDATVLEKDFFQKTIDFIFNSNVGKDDILKLHRDLEELASNDLFIQAARLRTL